jgi:hypothetical protein
MRISRLIIHRVEALVRVVHSRPLDRWQRALLNLARARIPCGGELLNNFTDLQLDTQVLAQFVRELTSSGFLALNGSGFWRVTPAGQQALETGAMPAITEARRTFAFVDNRLLDQSPHFLPLQLGPAPLATTASPAAANCAFEINTLAACIRQSDEWKRRFRFPPEVSALSLPRSDEPPEANWPRVVLDTVEERLFLFLQKEKGSSMPRLLGFSVRPEGWVIEPEPQLALGDGWEEALPDLASEPSADMWRQAWKTWTQPRGLSAAEVEACRLQKRDNRLLVHAPPRLIDRLRSARSDAIKHEAWVLAGEGRTRVAAQLELLPLH